MLDDALPYIVTLASMFTRRLFAALHPRRFLRPAADGPAANAARAAPLDALSGRASRVWLASWSGSFRRSRSARSWIRRCMRCSGRPHRQYSLAVWHGFTFPLLMSGVALAGGVATLRGAAQVPADRRGGAAPVARPECRAHFRARAGHGVVALGQIAGASSGHPASAAATAAAGLRRAGRRPVARLPARPWRGPDHIRRRRSGLCGGLGCRHRLRLGQRLPCQISPVGGSHPRRRRRTRHMHHVRLAVRASISP